MLLHVTRPLQQCDVAGTAASPTSHADSNSHRQLLISLCFFPLRVFRLQSICEAMHKPYCAVNPRCPVPCEHAHNTCTQ